MKLKELFNDMAFWKTTFWFPIHEESDEKMKIEFCCDELKKAVVQHTVIIPLKGSLEIITLNAANQAVAVELVYCPFCGDKIEPNKSMKGCECKNCKHEE